MTDEPPGDGPVLIALALADPDLSDRLATLLAGVPGVQLVADATTADAVLSAPDGAAVIPDGEDILTPREHEVLALIAEGASNRLIAERLGISVHTAKFHVGQVIDKLDATGRTDAVAHAARTGVIHL